MAKDATKTPGKTVTQAQPATPGKAAGAKGTTKTPGTTVNISPSDKPKSGK